VKNRTRVDLSGGWQGVASEGPGGGWILESISRANVRPNRDEDHDDVILPRAIGGREWEDFEELVLAVEG
jgi:hypothetical protein